MNIVPKNIKILYAVSVLILAFNGLYLLSTYNNIPATVVVHSYNGIDTLGDKSYLHGIIYLNAVIVFVIGIAIFRYHKLMVVTAEIGIKDRLESIYNRRLILAIVSIKVSILFSIILFKG
ncbi:hypothetical protein [Flavobacterium psychrotrophum]|uniref:hypothetical protein n=1 Tax=Flavobacterium psychrotrophum TaxID=2294119 RepID=UPI000E30C469|nr:hypothetical protein [Flavobacterium psychrotrophum]